MAIKKEIVKAKQKQLAELMIARPELQNKDYIEIINIDHKTFYKWKASAEFQEYLHSLCQEKFKDLEKLAIFKLKEQLKKGNWKAIEYVLNSVGYKPSEQQEIALNAQIEIDYGED